MKWRFLLFTGMAALLFFSWVFFKNDSNDKSSPEKVRITLRKIGHEILLKAGDSSSRVLPIEQIDPSTYIIKFEHSFYFEPDTLVRSIHRSLHAGNLAQQYLVEVTDCSDSKRVFYSYEILQTLEGSNIPCVGRKQPSGCYVIKVKFTEGQISTFLAANYLKMLSVPMIIVLFVVGWRKAGKRRGADLSFAEIEEEGGIRIGKLYFIPEKQLLKNDSKKIELSAKESRLLKVFALKLNEIIDRDQLLKEVWEDDGVFVGRSLDVFVSKLRKKLQSDQAVRIVNIHGKGYKLEVSEINEL